MDTDHKMGTGIDLGGVQVPGRVWISPMTGVSDLPFRRVASGLGAAYVATEMVACEQLALGRPDALRRAAVGDGLPLMVVQLVGADPRWISRAARLARGAGAQVIDLNFGCPAKSVTGVACGSALMRDLELAGALVSAAVEAQDGPVTVKMRLGWDATECNAPELAVRAQTAGARAFTVHGRTRAQFYSGVADWRAVRAVKQAVSVSVVVNGDIVDAATSRMALELSGADAVMVGRGAIGRPWIAAEIEAAMHARSFEAPQGEALAEIVIRHLEFSLAFHGERLGGRTFRKHLAAYINGAALLAPPETRCAERRRLCQLENPRELSEAIRALFAGSARKLAA